MSRLPKGIPVGVVGAAQLAYDDYVESSESTSVALHYGKREVWVLRPEGKHVPAEGVTVHLTDGADSANKEYAFMFHESTVFACLSLPFAAVCSQALWQAS
jgi:hypothetical protein